MSFHGEDPQSPLLPVTVPAAAQNPNGKSRKLLALCAVTAAAAAAAVGAVRVRPRRAAGDEAPPRKDAAVGGGDDLGPSPDLAPRRGLSSFPRSKEEDDAELPAPDLTLSAASAPVDISGPEPAGPDGTEFDHLSGVSLIEAQFGPDPYQGVDKLDLVLRGELSLVDVRVLPKSLGADADGYEGVTAHYCRLEWGEHKKDPSRVPTFRDLVGASPNCADHRYSFDLSTLTAAAKSYDATPSLKTHSIEPTAFIFHMGKSGSTLLTNALAVTEPERTRVVNEHGALVEVLNACDRMSSRHGIEDCDEEKQMQVFRDVMYLLGRTADPAEDRLYVKFQPSATVNLGVVRRAFPDTKWAFAYRDADVVLAKSTSRKRNSCAKNRSSPSKALKELGYDLKGMSEEEVCSAYLSTIVSAALDEHESTGTGRMINYDAELKSGTALVDDILPSYFEVGDVDAEGDDKRMRVVEQMGKRALQRTVDRAWTGEEAVDVRSEVKAANDKYLKNVMDRLADRKTNGSD